MAARWHPRELRDYDFEIAHQMDNLKLGIIIAVLCCLVLPLTAEETPAPGGASGPVAKIKEEEKSTMQNSCQYGADGKVRKTPIGEQPEGGGKLSVSPPDASGMVQVGIRDYLKSGDSVTIDVNAAAGSLSGMAIAACMERAKDAVRPKVGLGTFDDGTIYTATIHLDVEARELAIDIENSGYKKLGS